MKLLVEQDIIDTDMFTPYTAVQMPCPCIDNCNTIVTLKPHMLQVNAADGEVYIAGQVIDVEEA